MGKVGGGGMIAAALVLVFLGLVLRLGIIDWLIDATGLLLIIIGIILGIVGIIQLFSGDKSSSAY